MQLFSSTWHIFSSVFVFIFGLLISVIISTYFKTKKKRSVFIYFWHTIFCFIYAIYALNNDSDAVGYYIQSINSNLYFSLGTDSVILLTSIFTSILFLSFFGTFLVFNIFGFIGLLAFDACLQYITFNKSKNIQYIATIIILLPSISFWSSAIGKDALSFMATGLALWSALNFRRRSWLMVIAICIMLLVRPHIAGLMVMAIAGSMVLQSKVSVAQRALVGGAALAGAALLIPFALNYSGLGSEAGTDELAAYIEQRQGHNQEGGGGIDISSMSPPMQLFTYLFRPLPFEASNIFSLAASLDNMVLLLLFIWGGWVMIKRRKRYKQAFSENRMFLWIYSISTWLILALTTANLGISVRQKWMFVPMLIFLFISMIGRPRKNTIVADPSLSLDDGKKS